MSPSAPDSDNNRYLGSDRIADRWPVLAGQLADALRAAGEYGLASSAPQLRVVALCSCGDDFCQSFYTEQPPDGAWGPGHLTLELIPAWDGYLLVDVVHDRIHEVEVLFRQPLD